MGTKIEYRVNPLGSIELRDPARFCVDDWARRSKKTKTKKNKKSFGISMDRMFENVDSIKKTMEMHEHTFKHQVQELHRLYTVQKVLMNDLKQRKFLDPVNKNYNYDNTVSYTKNSEAIDWNKMRISRDDLSYNREGSGSCSRGGFDLERPAEEAAISTVDEEDSDIELTLSIGSGLMSKKRSVVSEHKGVKELDSSASFKADREGESDPNTPMSSSSATFDQDRKHPHWLFHGGLKL